MTIEEQFNKIAREYDANRRKFIPCFDDYYSGTTNFIAANVGEPKRILDLGAGTGLLSHFWFSHFPKSEFVLCDIAEEMLDVARKRFLGIPNVRFEISDYAEKFPDGDFDCVISALSIHHLEDWAKRELFSRIYDALPVGGTFANYDQFCTDSEKMDLWYNSYWENYIAKSELSEKDISLLKERRKLDRECSVMAEVQMLQEAGFANAQCVYECQKFAVIAAVK